MIFYTGGKILKNGKKVGKKSKKGKVCERCKGEIEPMEAMAYFPCYGYPWLSPEKLMKKWKKILGWGKEKK